ncbi:MAG: hypothetical protein ACXADC_17285 [Candidatus Thorarchaeota archaeon]|jgi:hypothetical protein
MRKTEDLHHRFLTFEDELGLFSKRVAGVLFWERLRTRIYFQIYFRVLASQKQLIPSFSLFLRFRFYFFAFFNLLRNTFLTRKKDVLIVGHQRRLLFDDERWWDIYTDPFIDRLDLSYVAMEESYELRHRTPARTFGLRYFDFLDFVARLRSFLGLSKIQLNDDEQQYLGKLQQEITDRFGISLNVEAFVTSMLKIRLAKLPLYMQLLQRVKPKLLLMVNCLGKENLIEACKILKIPTAELQHGIMNKFHPTYSFPGERRRVTFPDYLLVWGDYWKDSADYPISSDHIISVGFPYLEQELNKLKSVKKKPQILFISQAFVGEKISKLALALSEIIGSEYNIAYKMHPAECDVWKEMYPWLVGSNVDIIDQKESNLHMLFAESIAQVGVGSTALYEGLAHGLDTYVMDTDGSEYFDDLAQRGIVQMISSAKAFWKHFEHRKGSNPTDSEYFFMKNSTENIARFVRSFK